LSIARPEASTKTPLKRDNITPEEVAEVIKDYRAKKIEYRRYQEVETNAEQAIKDKLTELERIFSTTSNEMEWKKLERRL
jgi:thioredoxin-related protein